MFCFLIKRKVKRWEKFIAKIVCGLRSGQAMIKNEPKGKYSWDGKCHRHSPDNSGFPRVTMDNWCGDGENKTNKNKTEKKKEESKPIAEDNLKNINEGEELLKEENID